MCMGMGGDAGICCLTLKLNVGEMASSIYSTAWSSAKVLADAKDWTVLATFVKFEPSTPIDVQRTFQLALGEGPLLLQRAIVTCQAIWSVCTSVDL